MHLLDKRSTRALPVAAMIHDNSTDRTAFVPATHHSNFCPINFRCCARSHSAEGTSAWASRIASPPITPPQWGCVSFGAETGLPCPWCGWPKKESPLTDARLVVVVKAFVSSRADAREALSNDPNVSSCNDASTATPGQAGLPAEFKHINKRRKRNLQGFP
ncbi:hypothetical protein L6452_45001 [Arctium lappa]|nr:hypothetical protein L6452_45001 [Arctium lappa]